MLGEEAYTYCVTLLPARQRLLLHGGTLPGKTYRVQFRTHRLPLLLKKWLLLVFKFFVPMASTQQQSSCRFFKYLHYGKMRMCMRVKKLKMDYMEKQASSFCEK